MTNNIQQTKGISKKAIAGVILGAAGIVAVIAIAAAKKTESICNLGERKCNGRYVAECKSVDGVNEWVNTTNCPSGCANGECISQTCTEDWQCAPWSVCANGTQTRTCTDSNNCGTTRNKPIETQNCTIDCSPDWQCTPWSACNNGVQTRRCYDANQCAITPGKPDESQSCCTEGQIKCESGNLVKCHDGSWEPYKSCELGCTGTICKECLIIGATQCSALNPNEVQQCSNFQWIKLKDCNNGCENGACKPNIQIIMNEIIDAYTLNPISEFKAFDSVRHNAGIVNNGDDTISLKIVTRLVDATGIDVPGTTLVTVRSSPPGQIKYASSDFIVSPNWRYQEDYKAVVEVYDNSDNLIAPSSIIIIRNKTIFADDFKNLGKWTVVSQPDKTNFYVGCCGSGGIGNALKAEVSANRGIIVANNINISNNFKIQFDMQRHIDREGGFVFGENGGNYWALTYNGGSATLAINTAGSTYNGRVFADDLPNITGWNRWYADVQLSGNCITINNAQIGQTTIMRNATADKCDRSTSGSIGLIIGGNDSNPSRLDWGNFVVYER